MTQDINKLNNYIADDGKVFVSKKDNSRWGWIISLGEGDSIENYTEEDMNMNDLALKRQFQQEQQEIEKANI